MTRLVATFAALAAMTAPALAQDANADVRAAADAFVAAQHMRDRASLETLLAPDYLAVLGSGRVVGKRELIDGLTAPGATLQPPRIVDRLFLRLAPDAAVVGGEAWVEGRENNQPFKRHFRFSDALVRRDGKWLITFSQITPLP